MINLFFILFVFVDIIRLSEVMTIYGWLLALLRDMFLALGLISLIVFGIRKIRQRGLTFKRILVPLVGILGMLLLFFLLFFAETKIKEMISGIGVSQDKVVLSEMKEINLRLDKIGRAKYLWLGLLFGSVAIGLVLPVKRDEVE